jgi:hypothetical protein
MAPTPQPARPAWPAALLRSAVAIFGGYALAAAWVAVSATWWPALLGVSRSDGVVLSAVLGFGVYLLLLLWAFVDRWLPRVVVLLTATPLLAWAWILGIGTP